MVFHYVKRFVKARLPNPLLNLFQNKINSTTHLETPRFTSLRNDGYGTLECCIAYTESGGFCVPLSSRHRPAAQEIMRGSIYEPQTIEFLASNCNDGDIVHAGTYFGDFLPALSRACAPRAKVWAFEPNPENFRCAAVTCAINDLQNVELRNAGLGAQQDTMAMLTKDRNGQSLGGVSRLVGKAPEDLDGLTEPVNIVVLDDVVPNERNISIIQLDVEGYEKLSLTGALKTISRCLPVLVLEDLPDMSWLSDNILRLGYTVDQKIHENTVLMPPPR